MYLNILSFLYLFKKDDRLHLPYLLNSLIQHITQRLMCYRPISHPVIALRDS